MTSRQQTLLAAVAIVAAGVAVYANSFNGVYLLDDESGIAHNETIHQIWPDSFHPPIDTTMGGRPLLNITLAMNYAVGETNRFGFHLVNLAIHLCCSLLVFALVRRTLQSPRMEDRFGRVALPIAAATALLWVVHPLQTQAVTYIIQRCESQASLLYLLTVYCAVRGMESGRLRWYLASAAACALGATAKETLVSAPLIVLAYDWLFVPGAPGVGISGMAATALRPMGVSPMGALAGARRPCHEFVPGTLLSKMASRWWFYLALAMSWTILYGLLTAYPMSARQSKDVPPALQYALWQPWNILHYLKLAVWPSPLVLLYRSLWPLPTWEVVTGFAAVAPLLALTAWGLIRRHPAAFLGVWFFGILAPTSSFYPLVDVIMDHRMYLPIAAVIVLATIGLWQLVAKAAPNASRLLCGGLLMACLVALGATTVDRNALYADALDFWRQNVRYTPNCAIAHRALADALRKVKRYDEAIGYYHRSLDLDPHLLDAYINLGVTLTRTNRPDEAIHYLELAARVDPTSANAAYSLGEAMEMLGRLEEALVQYNRAAELTPRDYTIYNQMGNVLLQLGRLPKAIDCYRRGLAVAPQVPELHSNLGVAYWRAGDLKAAEAELRTAVQLNPNNQQASANLQEVEQLLRGK